MLLHYITLYCILLCFAGGLVRERRISELLQQLETQRRSLILNEKDPPVIRYAIISYNIQRYNMIYYDIIWYTTIYYNVICYNLTIMMYYNVMYLGNHLSNAGFLQKWWTICQSMVILDFKQREGPGERAGPPGGQAEAHLYYDITYTMISHMLNYNIIWSIML